MDPDKLQKLMGAHNEFVRAASLPENTRPYSVQSRLEEVQKLIMEEIKKDDTPKPKATTTDDDIPF